MRRIKLRRIYLFNALFFASVFVLYEFHANIFFRELAERQLGKLFHVPQLSEKSDLGMKRLEIDRGLWYPLIKSIPTLTERHIRITHGGGFINANIEKRENGAVIKAEINRIRFQNTDFTARCRIFVDTSKPEFEKYNVILKDAVINDTPFGKKIELSLIHDKSKKVLNVKRFKIGDEIEGRGYFRLASPNYAFLRWTINNLNVKDYVLTRDLKKKTSGILNGDFLLKGPILKASLKAYITARDGGFGDFKFNAAMADLRGEGPVIYIKDSKILKEDSSMALAGKIDLGKLKEGRIFEDISLRTDTSIFAWEGWSAIKDRKES